MSYGNKELFKKYGSGFVDVVCSMLLTEERMSDQLFGAAIRFLTRVGGTVACYFSKEISHYHNENITDQKVKSHIVSCLPLFDENPTANWRYKECAIYLVDSLGNRVADVESFFRLYIVPELESQDVNAFPMLKAASLKFLTTFQRIPNVKSINGTYKVSVVASSKLLCESPLLLDPAAEVLCGKLLDGIVTLLSQLEDKPYFEIQDPLKEIKDPKRFLLTSLANLSSQFHQTVESDKFSAA
ncbi:exportin-2 [Tanacetum coccineum]